MKVYTIGGFNEVGKNMTVVETGDDAFIFDMGLYLPPIVELEEQERNEKYTEKKLRMLGAVPQDDSLDNLGVRNKVRVIFLGHAHLDHIGAVPYIAQRYNAEVIGTPFTIEVLKTILRDEDIRIRNRIKIIQPNSSYTVSGKHKNYTVDFINITHSTLQTSMVALHTPEGTVLYANDFKFDNSPILGKKPNYEKLKELAREGVKVLIVDSLYSGNEQKTPSEKVARTLLEDVMLTTSNENSCIIATTFSSHIARLKSIVDFGKQLNRRIVFIGRSLNKYVSAARKVKLCPFYNDVSILSYKNQIKSALKKINKNRTKYLLVCTGHQGEPGSALDRLSRNELPFSFRNQDHIIFSSSVIPSPVNVSNRNQLEKRLKQKGVRIFGDVHVSVLPDTEVVFNGSDGMKIKEIGKIEQNEKQGLKVPAFDSDFKIGWFDANLIEHNYNGRIFNIHTKSGREVSITSGHSLFKLEKGKLVSEIGDNLKIGDYLAVPKQFSWYKRLEEIDIKKYAELDNKNYKTKEGFLFYNDRKISPLKIKLNKDFARILGYYLAEGSAPRHISLVIGKHETDILEEIKNSINSTFPSTINVYERGNSYEICFGARILGRLFKKWFGNSAKTKKIPEFVFSSSEDFKLNFLGKYINGDGSIDKGKKHFRIRIKTASKKLASDLLYLFSQIGICAKFDHVEICKNRIIAGNKVLTPETYSYVIRIQGAKYLEIIKNYLSDKFRIQIEKNLKERKWFLQLPPEALPVEKLDLKEIEPKKATCLYDIKYYNENCKKKKKHISPELIKNQAISITGLTDKILKGELLFDPIVEIKISSYEGKVYDFEVPGAENFIGGFGGIMLHNSGHASREDLRDFLTMINPEHIIPAHGDLSKLTPMAELASELGYKFGKEVHIMQDTQKISL